MFFRIILEVPSDKFQNKVRRQNDKQRLSDLKTKIGD